MPNLPQPPYAGVPFVTYGASPFVAVDDFGGTGAGLRQLIGWGDSAPAPLGLTPIERISVAFYGDWVQTSDGTLLNMDNKAGGVHKDVNGNWIWGGVNHGPALCWASDPISWKPFISKLKPGNFVPALAQVTYGELEAQSPAVGVDTNSNGNAPTALNLFAWGNAVQPSQRLTAVEMRALATTDGWAKTQSKAGSGVIQLSDPRYEKQPDGTWLNRNHTTATDVANASIVVDVAARPEHGVGGLIDAIYHDVANDPLGGILLLIVAIPLAGLGSFFLAFAEGDAVAIGVSQALGSNAVLNANGWAITHPAEIGKVAAGAALVVAGIAVGNKKLATLGGGLVGEGVGESLQGDAGLPPGAHSGADYTSQNTSGPPAKRAWWQILGGVGG